MTIGRLTLALVVAAVAFLRSAAKSPGTFPVGWRPRAFGRRHRPVCGSGAVVCSWSLLIRGAQRARHRAETPPIALCRFPGPALTTAPTPLSSARSIPLRSMTCSAGPAMIGFFKVTPPTVVERSIPIASGPIGCGCSGLPRGEAIAEIARAVLCPPFNGHDHREVYEVTVQGLSQLAQLTKLDECL